MDNSIKKSNSLKTQTVTFSSSCAAGASNSVTKTYSELSTIIGVSCSGGAEFCWLKSVSFIGNTVTCVLGNNRVSGGPGSGSYSVTAYGY